MMSKFQEGDMVIVVGVSDLDGEFGPAGAMITDPEHEITMDWQNPPQTLIGQIGVIVEAAMNDYYDVGVQFDWNAKEIPSVVGGAPGYEFLAFKEQDLEPVAAVGYKVTGVIPTPMYNPKRPVFDHDESTRPPRTGKRSLPYPVGAAGRVVEVISDSPTVAETLAGVWNAKGKDGKPLFENVQVKKVAIS
jgi:hypothetical protein